MDAETVVIAKRFQGPPNSGNGGYVCGRVAAYIDGPASVRLRVPPPLEEELEIRKNGEEVSLVHGETVIAVGRPAKVELEVPAPPTYVEAEAASRRFRGFDSHWFPCCFVCGPKRGNGDGLRIFPGHVPMRDYVACPWIPDTTLGDEQGNVRPEFLWSALDCPGAFSFPDPDSGAVLLGEFAVSLSAKVAVGERCILIGWEFGREGRKHFTGTALFSEAGVCYGFGRATWFEVP